MPTGLPDAACKYTPAGCTGQQGAHRCTSKRYERRYLKQVNGGEGQEGSGAPAARVGAPQAACSLSHPHAVRHFAAAAWHCAAGPVRCAAPLQAPTGT